MLTQDLRSRLDNAEVVAGLGNMYPAAGIIEGMCQGWDFVWIDAQHGQLDYNYVLEAVRTAASIDVASVVRPPGISADILGIYADMAPAAIMVPMTQNASEVNKIVEALHFPPKGKRSFGGRRIIDLNSRNYYKDSHLMVVAQIETPEGVTNAEAIIGVDGIDMLFFGADDFRIRLDVSVNQTHMECDEIMEAMRDIANAAKKAGKSCGTVAATPELIKASVEMGFQMIVAGGDNGFLRGQSKKKLEEVHHSLKAN